MTRVQIYPTLHPQPSRWRTGEIRDSSPQRNRSPRHKDLQVSSDVLEEESVYTVHTDVVSSAPSLEGGDLRSQDSGPQTGRESYTTKDRLSLVSLCEWKANYTRQYSRTAT